MFTVTWNIIALLITLAGKWSYAQSHAGAFVLGNILIAILVRNELFGRLLYLIVNTLFSKVFSFLPTIDQLSLKLCSVATFEI